MNKGQVISAFLKSNTVPDLAALYTPEMETHVDVVPGPEKVKTDHGYYYTDPKDSSAATWAPFRIPSAMGAGAEAPSSFSTDHYLAIGMSGWNYAKKCSHWVGFDFDSVVNHAKGISEAEINRIKATLSKWPWATVRASTSGKGLHIYVFFLEPVPTETRTEHAALARSILGVMSVACSTKLEASVDCFGAILWVYHRNKMCSDSFVLVQQGRALDTIPHNWRDHLGVVSGKQTVTRPQPDLDELTAKTQQFPLTDEHKMLLQWFTENHHNYMWWWDSDRSMLVCHTHALAAAHRELNLRGPFTTKASGKDAMDHNCFAFPLTSGWVVRRFGKGTKESNIWTQDAQGWTRTYFDRECDFDMACLSMDGVVTEADTYLFRTLEQVANAMRLLKLTVEVADELAERQAIVTRYTDNKIKIVIERSKQDEAWMPGWAPKGKAMWEKTVIAKSGLEFLDQDLPDETVRFTRIAGMEYGWYLKLKNEWTSVTTTTLKDYLKGVLGKDAATTVAKSVSNPWTIDNTPFQPEEPGGRKWSRNCAKLAYEPCQGQHRHWDLVLANVGRTLDDAVKSNEWCRLNGVFSGAEYLLLWLAFMINRPETHLPYLFLYSPEQDSGKSIFHEAATLLFKDGRGSVRAATALTSNFNGELANAVLCVVEELNLSRAKDAYAKIKDWITSDTLTIRAMYKDAVDMRNYTHWVQCSNEIDACPIGVGDTRVVMIQVYPPENKIPKPILMSLLRSEASAFMHTLRNVTMPDAAGRLALPLLETEVKRIAQRATESEVEKFFRHNTFECAGQAVTLKAAHRTFISQLPDQGQAQFFPERRFIREIPIWIQYGILGEDTVIINRSLVATAIPTVDPYVIHGGKVYPLSAVEKKHFHPLVADMEL